MTTTESIAMTYVYVDTAFGSVARRNHVQRISDVQFDNQGAERYISHRRATEALLDWTRTHTNSAGNPTVEGFDGAVWDPSLPFDFDDKQDPAHALGWVREFLDRQARYEVPLDALRIYFSGAKGFHLEIPHTLFGGFQPDCQLNIWERAAAVELMGGIPFDHSIYDKLRLWRLTNTLNAKGKRYKVRLTLDEARRLSMRDIDALAQSPRARIATAPDEEWTPNDYLVEVWQRAQQPAPVSAPQPDWSDLRHNQVVLAAVSAAIARAWPSEPGISRHTDYLLPLAGFLARQLEAAVVAEVLRNAAEASGDRNFLDDRQRHWEQEIERMANDSARKLASGQPVEGLPTIAKRWPELAEFLGSVFVVVAARSATGMPKEAGMTFTTLQDLLAEPPENVAFLVDGLLPSGGVSLWGAKPKVGKSVGVRNLALAVSTGEAFLGRATHQGVVLVLCLEEKRAEVANHFRKMGASDENVHVHVGAAPASSKEGLAELSMALNVYRPNLVIVDPVFKLVRVKDSSDYAELTRELEPVIELARNHNCHIALTHHLGKLVRDGGDDVLGSTAIFGAVDTLVLLRRRKDDQRTFQTIQRYGKDMPETLVPLDEVTERIGLGYEVSVARLLEARDAILKFLGSVDDEGADEKGIREGVSMDSKVVHSALQRSMEVGEIERSGAGRRHDPYLYRLAQFGPKTGSTDKKGGGLEEVVVENESFLDSLLATSRGIENREAEKPPVQLCVMCQQDTLAADACLACKQVSVCLACGQCCVCGLEAPRS